MNLDEWVDLLKNVIGPGEFRPIAIEFLRNYYGGAIQYADGTGDGGVDAWVILNSEPSVRIPAQFHAGRGEPWDHKLSADVEVLRGFRERLAPDDPRRLDLSRVLFVCTQSPSALKVEELNAELQRAHGFSIQVFDARAIASSAIQTRGPLLDLLAQRLPGAGERAERELPDARDEMLLAFAFFHTQPTKYRWEVSKSAIATILHRNPGGMPQARLLDEAATLLRLSPPQPLLARALRNLEREQKVVLDGDAVRASPTLAQRTLTTLTIAATDEDKLRRQCEAALEPLLPKGVHHRTERARRAVAAIFGDLGVLVRNSVAERALGARTDAELHRWQAIERRLANELTLDRSGVERAFGALVRVVADSPFARSLAAAELFLRITEHDADELARVLETPSPLRVVLDASIAMPMLCALYDLRASDWETSVAAHTLYGSLRGRGARLVVPSVYIEEIAAHLMKARAFAHIVETEAELERSRNFFVAHFCSTRELGEARSVAEFHRFLAAFGAPRACPGPGPSQVRERRRIEHELTRILGRYGIEVADVLGRADDPELVGEPCREGVLLRHDRAVVRWLTEPETAGMLLCTADRWLQGVLSDYGVVALDSAALADLFELVRPAGTSRGLLTPLAIAQTLAEEDRVLAASVWDEIVALEDLRLADWRLIERAREFRTRWLAGQRDPSSLSTEWLAFRDAAPRDPA